MPSKLDSLIQSIADPQLREGIAREVACLKKETKFGLVFEEHLPELLPLPRLPVRKGCRVLLRRGGRELFTVRELRNDGTAALEPVGGGAPTEALIAELLTVKAFGEPVYPVLTPVARLATGGPHKPWHTIIDADNYHALQLLLYCYEGQVDVIYIDPPYNSGARDWKYNNDYVDASNQWRHSKWLSMMKRRMVLAKRLLKPDGVFIVTIDENEVHHLGMLLAEVFPEYLRHMLTTVINPKGTGKLNFARMDEHAIFCVPQTGTNLVSGNRVPFLSRIDDAKDEPGEEGSDAPALEQGELIEVPRADCPFPPEEADQWELRHARRRGSESSYRHQRPNQFYAIYIDPDARRVVRIGDSMPVDAEHSMAKVDGLAPIWPIDEEGNHRCWRFIPATMRDLVAQGRVILGRYNRARQTWTLNIWERKSTTKKVKSVWWSSRHDAGTHGTTLLHKILGRRDAFPFPKSLYVVRDTLSTVCGTRPNALIVDFFAGSGTTYHATALLNAEDDGNRRCVLVTNNEVAEKLAKQLGADGLLPGDPDFEQHGICGSVTWPRCKYVTQGRRDDGTPLPGSYLDGREMQVGFTENLEYFRLDFAEAVNVARGRDFAGIQPLLWLTAGACGERETHDGKGDWFIPANSPYAVLLREEEIAEFADAVRQRPDIGLVFLVTNSQEAFNAMAAELPDGVRKKILYKSYLKNFEINAGRSV
jgi:adenine-specific DNA-methyltransferase